MNRKALIGAFIVSLLVVGLLVALGPQKACAQTVKGVYIASVATDTLRVNMGLTQYILDEYPQFITVRSSQDCWMRPLKDDSWRNKIPAAGEQSGAGVVDSVRIFADELTPIQMDSDRLFFSGVLGAELRLIVEY